MLHLQRREFRDDTGDVLVLEIGATQLPALVVAPPACREQN